MAVNPLKIFLFLLGVSVAGGATAFVSGVLDPYIFDQNASAVADLPEPLPDDPVAPKDERLPGAGEEIPPATMAATPPPTEDAANAPPPTRPLHLLPMLPRRRRPMRLQPHRRQSLPRLPRRPSTSCGSKGTVRWSSPARRSPMRWSSC